MDSLNKIEGNKIEKHFTEINSRRIKKEDGENSALIYYSITEHNHIIDSLVNILKTNEENDLQKKEIISKFEYIKSDLKLKLNSITEFNTQNKIDSLFKYSENLKTLPNFAIKVELLNEKLDASICAELLLGKLNEKTKNF